MPDSKVREIYAYQLFVRLARPTLDWTAVAGGTWALWLGDVLDQPMADGARIIVLGFVAALYGVRTVEKGMGVA